ncbi:MAG: hypothetical protein ACRDGV_10825 [Candidatus Limnocylindria bacterium]
MEGNTRTEPSVRLAEIVGSLPRPMALVAFAALGVRLVGLWTSATRPAPLSDAALGNGVTTRMQASLAVSSPRVRSSDYRALTALS